MNKEITEDWLDILDTTNYEPYNDPDNTYKSYRFVDLEIKSVTTRNYKKKLCKSLIEQVEIFIPPSGSFNNADLRRYLELVSQYETSTTDVILGLSLAEYLIRQGELTKLRDENGKLIKKIGNMQKAVVLYRPLPKLLETLRKSGLGKLVKIDKKPKDVKEVKS